jgi:hypothetical protein
MTASSLLPLVARSPEKPPVVTAIYVLGQATGWTSATSRTNSRRNKRLIRWLRRRVAHVGLIDEWGGPTRVTKMLSLCEWNRRDAPNTCPSARETGAQSVCWGGAGPAGGLLGGKGPAGRFSLSS